MKIAIFISIMIQNLNAQIHLNRNNLAYQCTCDRSKSNNIFLAFQSIASIDPLTFNGLASLKTLSLYNNQLTNIDTSTFNGLTSLQELWLSTNQIKALDASTFNSLKSLQTLYLSNNLLSEINSTFKELAGLLSC